MWWYQNIDPIITMFMCSDEKLSYYSRDDKIFFIASNKFILFIL